MINIHQIQYENLLSILSNKIDDFIIQRKVLRAGSIIEGSEGIGKSTLLRALMTDYQINDRIVVKLVDCIDLIEYPR